MSKEFKEGFSKGIGITTGVLAIPVAGLLLFGAYRVLRFPVKKLLWSEEMYEYFDCAEKMWDKLEERNKVLDKMIKKEIDYEELPPIIKCERPTREWKWQPKK